jgi:hypothetical protein
MTITDTKALDMKRREEIARANEHLRPTPIPRPPVNTTEVIARRLQRRTWGRL